MVSEQCCGVKNVACDDLAGHCAPIRGKPVSIRWIFSYAPQCANWKISIGHQLIATGVIIVDTSFKLESILI